MAKNDHKRAQDMIYQNQESQNKALSGLDNTLNNSNNQFNDAYSNAYNGGRGYSDLMNQYQSFYNNPWNRNQNNNNTPTAPSYKLKLNPNAGGGITRHINGGFNENSGNYLGNVTGGDGNNTDDGNNGTYHQIWDEGVGGNKYTGPPRVFGNNNNLSSLSDNIGALPPGNATASNGIRPNQNVINRTMSGNNNSGDYSGLTGRALVTNRNYVSDQLRAKYASLHGGADMPADELSKDMNYVLTPDTYSDNKVRSGLSNYWMDRLFNPDASGASGADKGGDDTYISDSLGGGGGSGGSTPFGTNFGYMPASWKGWGSGDWGNYGNSAISGAQSGFEGMAANGGYSSQDIADMRARAIGGAKSIYSGARDEVNRGRALNGGYGPNNAAALAQMARNQGQAFSDANVNVNASIAQSRAQNEIAGMQGLSQLGQFGAGLHSNVDQFGAQLGQQYDQMAQQNNQFGDSMGFNYAQLGQQGDQFNRSLGEQQNEFGQTMGFNYDQLGQQGSQFDRSLLQNNQQFDKNLGFNYDNADLSARLHSLDSMNNLYSNNLSTTGNQLNTSNSNLLQAYLARLQGNNNNANNLMNSANIPGNFQSVLGNIQGGLNLAGSIGGMFAGLPPGIFTGNGGNMSHIMGGNSPYNSSPLFNKYGATGKMGGMY